VADKVKEEILVYDSLAHDNKHHLYGVKKLIDRMKTKKGNLVVDTQQLRDKEVFQRQHDGLNCGYFTSWYAHQLVTNQPDAGWSGNYHEEVQQVGKTSCAAWCITPLSQKRLSKLFGITSSVTSRIF
jgi:hypothetical protein